MATIIERNDVRFPVLSRGWNARFPAADEQAVAAVHYCRSAEEVVRALQYAVDAGLRPTARSSGHCYEDFIVNNPGGVLIDLSMMDDVTAGPTKGSYIIQPGAKLGNVYERLYKLGGAVIPGGTCFTVTAGGHISGGGYGTLARMYGLTVDWVTAIDIAVVNAAGKVEMLHVHAGSHPTLFRALRGGQGSNFGIITAFHFKELPPVPRQVIAANISWDWKQMTREKFLRIVKNYGDYWEQHDKDPATRPMFTDLIVVNAQTGRIGLGLQYAQFQGDDQGLDVVNDFLDRFQPCGPVSDAPVGYLGHGQALIENQQQQRPLVGDTVCYGEHILRRYNWVDSTISNQSGSSFPGATRRRAKYKSCYMKKAFTEAEATIMYEQMSHQSTRGLIIAIDSYGGAVNVPQRAKDTAIPQRSSIMKMQYQSYWIDAADDTFRLNGIRQCYQAMYSTSLADQRFKGFPFPNDHYDGCYINYPDVDMLQHPKWSDLYYGTGDLYPTLQQVKHQYDPHNIFHHAMSVQVTS